jgi:putative membrane protein
MEGPEKKGITDHLKLFLKGMGMGAADVVPGVSGGTIAFITNIYEELIHTLKMAVQSVRQNLLKGDLKGFFGELNVTFLIPLVMGIGTSILLLSRVVLYLLHTYPIFIWSFFFGLIIASAVVIYRKISSYSIGVFIAAIIGAGIAYAITVISPTETTDAWWFIFVSGFIAICAMILPGISGSFILLLLGKYEFILNSVKEFNATVISLFILGCIIGISVFSSILDWLLRRYHDLAVAVLSGFMIGSLNKVWPWKKTILFFTDSKGETKPLLEENIMPQTYEIVYGTDSFLLYAVLFGIAGFSLVMLIEGFSSKSIFRNS